MQHSVLQSLSSCHTTHVHRWRQSPHQCSDNLFGKVFCAPLTYTRQFGQSMHGCADGQSPASQSVTTRLEILWWPSVVSTRGAVHAMRAAPFLVRSAGGVAERASQAAEDLQGKREMGYATCQPPFHNGNHLTSLQDMHLHGVIVDRVCLQLLFKDTR